MIQDAAYNTEIAKAYQQEQPYRHIPHPPVFLIFSAIPGSGKTTLARKLTRDLKAQYVSHDDMRKIISQRGQNPEELALAPISRILINDMFAHDENKFVILDASLDRTWDIYFNHVKEVGAMPLIIRLNPPLDVIRQRLLARDGENGILLPQLDRFKREFDNSCQHVRADITVGEIYDYAAVLQFVKDRVSGQQI